MKIAIRIGVAVLAVVLAMVLLLLAYDEAEPQTQDVLCMSEEEREDIRAIMLAGIDAALKEHTQHMYGVWMRDPRDQPKRANVGMKSGVNAYLGARRVAQKWEPQLCNAK